MPSDDDCTLVPTGARRATLASPLSGSRFRIPARRSCATDPYAERATADNQWIVGGPHVMILRPDAVLFDSLCSRSIASAGNHPDRLRDFFTAGCLGMAAVGTMMWVSFLPFHITHGPRQSDRSGARREREPNHLGATGCRKGSQLSGVVQLLKTLRDSMFFERGATLKLLDPSFVRHTSLPSDEGDPLTPAHHQARL
jgi:hypothetical protein